MNTGILLVNLGTPDSPKPRDVHRYLIEFLTDARVIDIPWLWRHLLVRGSIVPKRYKQSALCYEKIWTPEGSPLLVYGRKVQNLLQRRLGDKFIVELAMRYQNPGIDIGISRLLDAGVKEIIVLPLFPQYASATTGSVHQKVMESLKGRWNIPEMSFINNFAVHPAFIEAVSTLGASCKHENYDHVLFSYHGLPERHLKKADKNNHCLQSKDCCSRWERHNFSCYAAQCHATTQGIVNRLNIPRAKYSICFQSRLGKDPWLQPYASDTIKGLALKGHRKVLVFCPSFVCDCLETTYEIGIEYAAEFKHAGGEKLDLVQGLNDHPLWIEALQKIILDKRT